MWYENAASVMPGTLIFGYGPTTTLWRRHPPKPDFWREPLFESRGLCSHSPPPVSLAESTAPPFPTIPSAPDLPRRTPRACLAARRQRRPVRSRPGAR